MHSVVATSRFIKPAPCMELTDIVLLVYGEVKTDATTKVMRNLQNIYKSFGLTLNIHDHPETQTVLVASCTCC